MHRREFMTLAGLASVTLLTPAWLRAAPAAARAERVLVLVELQGGNDGLNTVIPFRVERYYSLRPRLAIARDAALPLTPDLALHPALDPLMSMWRTNELALVLGVGYPNPNRSHFRSIEIWDTASNAEETLQEGWLARLYARAPIRKELAAHGVVLGGASGPFTGDAAHIVVRDAEQFMQQARRLREPPAGTHNAALAHLLEVQAETQHAATSLQQRLTTLPALETKFPATPLGRQLETAARLIIAGVPVPVIKVAHGGFDTHSNQRAVHDRLLGELAAALTSFCDALRQRERWRDVLVLTYSEFGRRAAENGSGGTDHGTAAPHFVLGGAVRGGLYGEQPSLERLADGDLVHRVDFRSVYATVARRFLGAPADFLGKTFTPLDFIA